MINTLARGEASVKEGALEELVAQRECKAAVDAAKRAKMQQANRDRWKRIREEREKKEKEQEAAKKKKKPDGP